MQSDSTIDAKKDIVTESVTTEKSCHTCKFKDYIDDEQENLAIMICIFGNREKEIKKIKTDCKDWIPIND